MQCLRPVHLNPLTHRKSASNTQNMHSISLAEISMRAYHSTGKKSTGALADALDDIELQEEIAQRSNACRAHFRVAMFQTDGDKIGHTICRDTKNTQHP